MWVPASHPTTLRFYFCAWSRGSKWRSLCPDSMCSGPAFIASITILTVLCTRPRSKPVKSFPAASNVTPKSVLNWFTNCATRKYCRSVKAHFSRNVGNWRKASQRESNRNCPINGVFKCRQFVKVDMSWKFAVYLWQLDSTHKPKFYLVMTFGTSRKYLVSQESDFMK